MIAKLWANQIKIEKKSFSEVPAQLKNKVKELLLNAGDEELTT